MDDLNLILDGGQLAKELDNTSELVQQRAEQYRERAQSEADASPFRSILNNIPNLDLEDSKAEEADLRAVERNGQLSADGRRQARTDIAQKYNTAFAKRGDELEAVGKKWSGVNIKWEDGPEWKNSLPRDATDQMRVFAAAQLVPQHLPGHHIREILAKAREQDLVWLSTVLPVSEKELETKSYYKGERGGQLREAIAIGKLAMRSPADYGREFITESVESMRVSRDGWVRALRDEFGPNDPLLDRTRPNSLAAGLLRPFEMDD